MDIKKLVRNVSLINSLLVELPNNTIVTTKPIKIYSPVRYSERGLSSVGVDTNIIGIYAIVTEEGYYAVSILNAMINITPSSTITVKIEGEEYYEFSFDAGNVVISNLNLVQADVLVYKIYSEIISKGKIPWYLSYSDLGHLFDTAYKYAGANIGQNAEITELIISLIARNPKDRTEYYRSLLSSKEDLNVMKPEFIALKSVQYSATNTLNKLAGSYMSAGVVSALIDNSTRSERIESIIMR